MRFCCGGTTDTLPREAGAATPLLPPGTFRQQVSPNKILGIRASDIDKYSRVVFPIMFLSFHLMYWMIYMNVGEVPGEVVYLDVPS